MRSILLTGATGLLGGELLRRMLQWEPDIHVFAIVRAVDEAALCARADQLLVSLFPDHQARAAASRRLQVVRGDVAAPRLGLDRTVFDAVSAQVTDIFNLAADVRFGLPLREATSISVGGAEGVVALAVAAQRQGRDPPRLHHVSTYAVGRPEAGSTLVMEAPPTRAFAECPNTYEAAKTAAELYLIDHAAEVPLTIYRPSIVLGDSRTGWTQDFKVTYAFWRLYVAGSLPTQVALPFERGSRIDQIHVDYAADSLYVLSTRPLSTSGSIYAIVAGTASYPTILALHRSSEAIRRAMRACHGTAPPILLTAEVDALTPEIIAQTYPDTEVRAVMEQFLPYFSRQWIYDDRKARAALEGSGIAHRMDDVSATALFDYCIRTRWGRRPEPRPPLGPRPCLASPALVQ